MSSAGFIRIVIETTESEQSWKLDDIFAIFLYKNYNKNNYQVNGFIWTQVSSENEKIIRSPQKIIKMIWPRKEVLNFYLGLLSYNERQKAGLKLETKISFYFEFKSPD